MDSRPQAGSGELLSIGEVAGRVGLRPSAIRYYEEAGLVRARDVRRILEASRDCECVSLDASRVVVEGDRL